MSESPASWVSGEGARNGFWGRDLTDAAAGYFDVNVGFCPGFWVGELAPFHFAFYRALIEA